MNHGLRFQQATEPHEFEQIAELNYRTFVEEIPQHEPNVARRLLDPLIENSTCYVCLDGETVVGMIAMSGDRPFSLDRKIPHLDDYLPPGEWKPSEFRLLAIEPNYRRGRLVIAGLLRLVYEEAKADGYNIGLISAAGSQIRLYRRMGFEAFGPPIGTDRAPYQAMYVTWERLNVVFPQLPVETEDRVGQEA